MTFRDANNRIVSAAGAIGVDAQRVPFICECADPSCTDVLFIELSAYEAVRRHPRWFLHALGHDGTADVEVERYPAYVVAEKVGRAGEIAEQSS